MTHLPKNPFCEVCSRAKIQRTQKRKKVPKLVPDEGASGPPTKFGEQVTADHFIKNGQESTDEVESLFPSSSVAVVMHDRGTKWLACYPKSTKSADQTIDQGQDC